MPNKKKQRKLSCPKQPSGIVDKPMYNRSNLQSTYIQRVRKTDMDCVDYRIKKALQLKLEE